MSVINGSLTLGAVLRQGPELVFFFWGAGLAGAVGPGAAFEAAAGVVCVGELAHDGVG